MNTLTCPKCQAEMRQYERNGVTVDQCGDCRGIFLDRGELERLIDAESRWSEQSRQPAPRQQDPRHSKPAHDSRGGHQRKRKHWLEELFD